MMPELRPEAVSLVEKVKTFIKDEVAPKEHVFHEQIQEGKDRWNSYPSVIDELKDKAKSVGLWNLFLPESEFGAGLTNYEYAHLAEEMGKSHIASEAMNCSAPDTGNMEVIARYGNEKHQEEWMQLICKLQLYWMEMSMCLMVKNGGRLELVTLGVKF